MADSIQLIVPGERVEATPDSDVSGLLNVRSLSSHQIKPPSRGETLQEVPVDVPPDALVKLEYASGLCEWLRPEQFVSDLGPQREAGPVRVPVSLSRGAGPSRSATEWVLKGLHVLGISPVDALVHETAEAVVEHFEGKLNTGLFRVRPDGSFGGRIDTRLTDNSAPYLVFIHGTASSTQGSFSGFWSDAQTRQATGEWNDLVKKYGDRILALEHRTFSVSPVQNAQDLAGLLPDRATLHVITHSRGGLVGELLGLPALSEVELNGFDGRPDGPLLAQLNQTLTDRKPAIAKFVRTACPAAGTILASDRMDLYLNVILNVIGLIPGLNENPAYEVVKATLLELIKLRADPDEIPGIEAQMPESPLIHLLNTRGRYSSSDLGVIAGNFKGSGVWGTLKTYALRAYYWEDNDFVVNTKSMAGGMDRAKGVWEYRDEGDTVNHFSYFKNKSSRSHMLKWLAAGPAEAVQDFGKVRGVVRSAARGAAQLPLVFVVPDVFGTHLRDDKGNVWLDYDALSEGRLAELAGPGLKPGLLHEIYQPLCTQLALAYDVVPFPYDWRDAVATTAAQLADAAVKERGASGRPVSFVAHGMGGLVVRELAARNPEAWADLCGKTGTVLMLGTPTQGSWRIARLLAGTSRLSRTLALLGRQTDAGVADLFGRFQGLRDLLPENAKDSRFPGGRIHYIAGLAAPTPSGLNDYSPNGDGDVVYKPGMCPGATMWFNTDASHGDLVARPGPLAEILNTGKTSGLDRDLHQRGSIPDSTQLSQQELAVLFPSPADVTAAALVLSETQRGKETTAVLRVRVVHGHLRDAKYPVAVGHYAGDGIVSAEAELDRRLEGRLSARFQMDLYPGKAGSTETILSLGARPPGALVVGLGDVGEITPEKVRTGVLEACLRHALVRAEMPAAKSSEPVAASFSSLLIGASGGRAITIAESVTSVVRAAIQANRLLKLRDPIRRVRIEEVQFIELYEDAAIEAAHAAVKLQERLRFDLQDGEQIEFDGRLRSLPGGLSRRPLNEYGSGWWRRVQISAAPGSKEGASTGLVFEALTDRARAEQSTNTIQTRLVDSLLEDVKRGPAYDETSGGALFELLVPNALKDLAHDETNLMLVLDPPAARYPWELMAERRGEKFVPLAAQMGMLRRLKVESFRAGPRDTKALNAFVVGDTMSDLAELPGAQSEARTVAAVLGAQGYATDLYIRENPLTLVRRLFARDYKILHLAGHGMYNAEEPARSGMILAKDVFLTPMELRQIRSVPDLVFINCCHLGTIDQPHRMAASIAEELIKMGVRAVIAAGWAVNDAAAETFARTFYDQMLSGRKFGESVQWARQAARALGENNTWGAYQCYGNPDFTLTLRPASGPAATAEFYSRRECLEELRDLAARAKGASGDAAADLSKRSKTIHDALPEAWQDGEVLFALAEAHKALGDFDSAATAYLEALGREEAQAPVKAIEQLANVLDRGAGKLQGKDAARAASMWDDAEKKLTGLNDLLGPTSERLSLLGALNKRRGPKFFGAAADFYCKAYEHKRSVSGELDPYSGLNAVSLAYLAGQSAPIAQECLAEAKRQRDEPSFWERIYRPDAILLEHLYAGDLDANTDAVVAEYRSALDGAAANERDSVIYQLEFLNWNRPGPGLQAVIDALKT